MTRIRTPRRIRITQRVLMYYVNIWREANKGLPITSIAPWVFSNTANVLRFSRYYLENFYVHPSTFAPWRNNGWNEFKFEHWYFAYVIKLDAVNGDYFAEIQSAHHESEHHNDTMQTKPYESISGKISKIIIETINTFLRSECTQKQQSM